MALRIFSVTGEALNFGGRRMETIVRVAWLPMALILIVNMATVFAYLSVIAGEIITFSDIPSYLVARQRLIRLAAQGWAQNPDAMNIITWSSISLQTILVASFMAPLIRYAGLGEKPNKGALRLPFGPDQIRYILAGLFSFLFVALLILTPTTSVSYWVAKYILDALAQTVATFPDPNSLHTIEVTTAGESLKAEGLDWIYQRAVPLAAAAPLALFLWLVVYLHFHPSNRPGAHPRGNPVLRAFVTFLATAIVIGGVYIFLREFIISFMRSNVYFDTKSAFDLKNAPVNVVLFFGIVAYLLVAYINLRLYPYPGVAVCRKSLALGGSLKVTRGWDILRLLIVLIIIFVTLIFVQTYFINQFLLTFLIPQVWYLLLSATAVTTRLINSGVTADWVVPVFIWIWNGVKIVINLFWAFFSYGVAAGLYGRLYRESQREDVMESAPSEPKAIWERKA